MLTSRVERDERGHDLLARVHRDQRHEMPDVVPEEDLQSTDADSRGALGEWHVTEAIELRAQHAVRPGPPGDEKSTDKDHDGGVTTYEHEDHEQHDERRGHRSDEFGKSVNENACATRPAARDREREAGGDPGDAAEHDDRQSEARTREHEAEEIASEDVRAEREHQARVVRPGIVSVLHDEVDRLVRRDPLAKERYEKKREEREEPDVDPRITSRH